MAKACIFLAGFTNPFLGYAIYFVMYDSDKEKGEYFRKGARAAILISILLCVLEVVLTIIGLDTILS